MGQCRSRSHVLEPEIVDRQLSSSFKHNKDSRFAHINPTDLHNASLMTYDSWLNQHDITLNEILVNKTAFMTIMEYSSFNDVVQLRNTSRSIFKIVFWKVLGSKSYHIKSMSYLKPDNTIFHVGITSILTSHVTIVYPQLNATKYNQLIPYLAFATGIAINMAYTKDKSSTTSDELFLSWKLLPTFKSCIPLRKLTLGSTGIISTITNNEFLSIIRKVGNQLEELSLIKLNSLTIESLDMIAHYCPSLKSLKLFACEHMRHDLNINSQSNNTHHIEQLLEAISSTIEEIDWRYSVEMTNGLLDMIMNIIPSTASDHNNIMRLRIFAASRTHELNDRECVCDAQWKHDAMLTLEKWMIFTEHFKYCDFLGIDSLYHEEHAIDNQPCALKPYINRYPTLVSMESVLYHELIDTWPRPLPDDFFQDPADMIASKVVAKKRDMYHCIDSSAVAVSMNCL